MPMNTHVDMPLWGWLLIGAVLLTQSTWLFYDARKRDLYPWIWGIWGIIQFPMPTICYYLLVRRKRSGR